MGSDGRPEGREARARVVIHGHFYQPPREDPWTGEIAPQPGAAPFRDWNARIHAECYHPNAFAQIPTDGGDLLVNNFERISFNVGPTLMTWLERHRPETYWRILDADRRSAERLGHGNAIAQAYHHTILPLSPERDARTQVRWGLGDFEARFGRPAEGLWLPETATNRRVLEILIEEGVRFTILAPWQARAVGRLGRMRPCTDLQIDTRHPYRYVHSDGSGREMTLFFYDADLARWIAFENAASSAEDLIRSFAARSGRPDHLVHAATDGETYGHHWRFADLGLAYALFGEAPARGIETINYAAYLDVHPPEDEVEVQENGSSWSCPHGVERWRADCGCSTASEPGWNQAWRTPLRRALEIVRASADEAFEEIGARHLRDAWRARDRYIDVVTHRRSMEEFLADEGTVDADSSTSDDLLQLQVASMSMFTSCAWFFADVSGIETVQILRYAERALQLIESLGADAPRTAFQEALSEAISNRPEEGTGADVYGKMLAGLEPSAPAGQVQRRR